MKRGRVLIVEDEQILQLALRENVTALGYEVVGGVDSGARAIELALELSPELILMDIRIKGKIDGIEAAEIIHRSKNIPIVYLTAYADDKTLARAKPTNPEAYLAKPINPVELKSAIELALYRKKMEEKVIQSEKRFRSIFENSLDTIFISTPEGQLVDINAAGCKLFGYTKEELLSINISELYLEPRERSTVLSAIDTHGGVKEHEFFLKTKQGKTIIALITASLVKDVSGLTTGYQGIIRDFTEKKQLEEKLIQAAKMESIGRLAGGMAHDFNNVLTIICGYAEKLYLQMQDKNAKGDLKTILTAVEKAARLIESILIFSRKKKMNPEPIMLDEILRELEKMLDCVLVEHMAIQLVLGSGGWIFIDKSQLEQVIMNLAVNARDAMPQGGKITISTCKRTLPNDRTGNSAGIEAGQYIELVVADTGIGMNDATREKIFEPFFSTKEEGKGTGLGLSTVYGIVKQNNGFIRVDSEVGKGAAFSILFPEFKGKRELATASVKKKQGHWKGLTVLVVEDEEQIVQLAAAIFDLLGFQVITAKDGAEALLKLDKFAGQLDVLFTDILLPGMPVSEIAEKVTALHPNVTVVYTSGYPGQHLSRIGVRQKQVHFIQKPYTSRNIADKLEEILSKTEKR
ncbi:MAG: response regulator [bacterium]|nr:response regulator [bacterium]